MYFRQVLATGRVERCEEETFTRSDGTSFPVECVASPIKVDGRVTGAVIAFHDLTERKALDTLLRSSEQQALERAQHLEATIDAMADGVIVYVATDMFCE